MGALRDPKLLKLEVRPLKITGLYSKSATTSLSNLCYNCIANDIIVRIRHNPSQSVSTACFTARFFNALTDGF